MRRLVPEWIRGYRRDFLAADAVAGLIVWSVVTPQAVAYAQIAGLPAQAGLMAAPGAMIGYALFGRSRSLVVSATTSTAAVSAAAVGPLAHGDLSKFAALSAALALVTAVVLVGSGLLKLGGVTDLISKPVMTGFLFGLGLTIAIGQLPKLFRIEPGSGHFFSQLFHLLGHLGSTQALTLVVGVISIALLFVFKYRWPRLPGTLIVLGLSIVVSAALGLPAHGVETIGKLPTALPHLAVPSASIHELVQLLPTAFGVMLLTTEGWGVARTLASKHHYTLDANRELMAIGASNLLAGLSEGFVQAGGASQTAAADSSGGKTQVASIVAAGLVLLTGAFLAPVFKDLPEATLGAIVIVAVSGFFRVDELRRFYRVRTSALVFALIALFSVLILGVLQGLIVAAAVSLIRVIQYLSRPSVGTLARDPRSGNWGRAERHPDWTPAEGLVVARVDGQLFYANSQHVKDGLMKLVNQADPRPRAVVLDMSESIGLDEQSVDTLAELADELSSRSIELRLAWVHAPVVAVLKRAGVVGKFTIEPTVDAAIADRATGATWD